MSKIKKPTIDIIDYIRQNYVYGDGRINGKYKNDIGERHKRQDGRFIIKISTGGRKLRRSHIVWFLCKDNWPDLELDHFDRDTLNDKIDNLREVTSDEQQQNKANYKGYKGHSIVEKTDKPRTKRWQVRKQSHKISLGYYYTEQEAKEAIDQHIKERGEEWKWV